MTANLFIKIGNASERVSSNIDFSTLENKDEYINLCKKFYSFIAESTHIDIDIAAKVDEFHSFGIVGGPNGEIMAPMIWSVAQYPVFWGKIVNANNVFVVGNPGEILTSASEFSNVYVCNNMTTYLLSKEYKKEINNVITLSYEEILSSMPSIDLAYVVSSFIINKEDYFSSILDAIKPGGLFILTNSSANGELYTSDIDDTLSDEIHNFIKSRGDFRVIHMQGYISYTLCFKG